MVRFSFSPNGANRQQSRKDRIEQAKRETGVETEKSSRRRNFGFLKNSESKRMSSTTLNRTREHAKQLALAFNDDPIVETPTSVNSGQGLLAFGGGGNEQTFDPFGNNSSNAFSPSSTFSTKRTVTNGSETILDQQFVSSTRRQEREPTTSTQDSFETASVGSAYEMDVFQSKSAGTNMFPSPTASASRKTKNKGRQPSLDQFVEKTRIPPQGPGSYSGASFDRSKAERSVISMPTFPSNSSMQASFTKQTSTPTSTSSSATGAAARRRFRNQLRQSSNSSVSSSVGGGDDSSYHSMTNTATPPESPASSRGQAMGSAGRNRVQNVQRTPHTGSSFNSQASSSANNSQQGSDSSTPNLFDSHNMDGGFTFDAFGLDQSQVEREVNEAMKALAGQGMREFSAFFNNDTDGEFPMQTWDSPANSRRSSPGPSDSETDGFVDGFRVTTKVTPSRSTYSHTSASSSPVSSSGERSFSSPMSRRLMRAQGRETIALPASRTPPRWEEARRKGGDVFGAPVSNPWKEDPWGSGDDDREFSDSGASDFGGTQSEIVGTSFSPQFEANFMETQSDVGVSTPTATSSMMYPNNNKSGNFCQDFNRQSPRHASSPLHSQQSSPRHQILDMGDGSDEDSAIVKQDLAEEYAQEFVQRVSPRHAQHLQQPQDFHDYGAPPRSHYDYNVPTTNYTQSQRELFEAEFGSGSDFSSDDQRQHEPAARFGAFGAASQHDQESDVDQDNIYEGDYGPTASRSPFPRNSQPAETTTPEPRFSSFRSKYELSRKTSAVSSDGGNADSEASYPTIAQGQSYEYGGSLRSSYNAAKSRSSMDGTPTTSNVQPAWKRSQLTPPPTNGQADYGPDRAMPGTSGYRAEEDETPSETSISRVEEKKEDEKESARPSANRLHSKWQQWENKSGGAGSSNAPPPAEQAPKWKPTNQGPQHSALSNVEFLTPEILEARRMEKRKSRTDELKRNGDDNAILSPSMLRSTSSYEKNNGTSVSHQRASECHDERSSFASLRERLKPSAVGSKAKSDIGTEFRSSVASSVVDRLRRESPRSIGDSKSDAGESTSPSFLAGVKLRKTGSSVLSEQSSEDQEDDLQSHRGPITPKSPYGSSAFHNQYPEEQAEPQLPAQRKLTYRERREMELKREQEQKAKFESAKKKDEPKMDVAALIRKRIAANKASGGAATNSKAEQYSQFRNNLKPVETGPPHTKAGAHQPSPTNASEQPQPPPRFQQSAPQRYSQDSRESSEYAFDEKEQGDALVDNLSPASGGTNLTYSTDNSQTREQLSSTPKSYSREPSPRQFESSQGGEERLTTSNRLEALLTKKNAPSREGSVADSAKSPLPPPVNKPAFQLSDDVPAGKNDVKAMLSNFLGVRNNPLAALPPPKKEDDAEAIKYAKSHTGSPEKKPSSPPPPLPPGAAAGGQRPALKDDPKYERYFRMLKVGMPMEVVKHAMQKDGNDPSVMDGDHDKPVGLPLKEDPKYTKYFKMLKMGISMPQVKHAMERDGLEPDVMDQDHNLPAMASEKRQEEKSKDTHRRARLHWKTLQKVTRNSLWSKIEKEPEVTEIDFDEEEFKELFQADMTPSLKSPKGLGSSRKKGAAVRVIDAKRANNGGIILARVKMSHDEMADAVDRIDGDALTSEQIENIIEFLPTKEERTMLEKYMLEGGQDAAEKFDGLCECEKFMVSMMTVKHAKRKVSALLFKLQFISCLQSIAEDAQTIEDACDELKHSSRLRQLLGIVLQFGNRLNTAGKASKNKAGAFTLDSLLKLSQAKAFDKKTTFLHYVVMIVHRNNEILLNFTDDLPTVMKADKVYWDQCLQDLEEVENQLENVRRISLYEARARKQNRQNKHKDDDDSLGDVELTLEEEVEALRATPTGLFTLSAIKQVSALRDKVEATRNKFVRVLEYFGEDPDSMQPHELFNIFCVFGRDFNKAKEEAFANMKKKQREERKKAGRNQAPNGNHGKPPSGPERKPALRASSMQPTMSKVINDFKSPPKIHQPMQQHGHHPQNDFQRPRPATNHNYHQQNQRSMVANSQRSDQGQMDDERAKPVASQNDQRSAFANNQRPVPSYEETTGKERGHQQQGYSQHSEQHRGTAPQSNSSLYNNPYDNPPPRPVIPDAPVPQGMQESGRFEEMHDPYYAPGMRQPAPSRETSAADAIRQKARDRRTRQMQIVTGRTTPVASNTSFQEARSPRSSPNIPEENSHQTGSGASSPSSSSSRSTMRSRRLQAMKRVNASRHGAAMSS